ncbi:MAG: hypothetical protein GY884_05065, partial [Proteobacteria bacterium]|nr:hypothetical protein [Pseudomonadota bacterium]
ADPLEVDCCAYWTDTFEFELSSAQIVPWRSAVGVPWDWAGNVPTDLLDGINDLEAVAPSASDFNDLLNLASVYAPDILSGSVPPDVYFEFLANSSLVDTSLVRDNTYEPVWNWSASYLLGPSDVVSFEFYDEDLVLDDFVGAFDMDLIDHQTWAGRGPLSLGPVDGLYRVFWEITPQ